MMLTSNLVIVVLAILIPLASWAYQVPWWLTGLLAVPVLLLVFFTAAAWIHERFFL